MPQQEASSLPSIVDLETFPYSTTPGEHHKWEPEEGRGMKEGEESTTEEPVSNSENRLVKGSYLPSN